MRIVAWNCNRALDRKADALPARCIRDGPIDHIDYAFLPAGWIGKVRHLSIGGFEDWCGAGLSDHVPVVVDIDV